MISLSKSGVAACIFALSFTSISAHAYSNPPSWYLGLNTGVSDITSQGFGHYDSVIGSTFFNDAREESSQSGYNLGGFIGWNLYTCAPFLFGLELSANWHSNRGHYTVDFLNTDNSNVSNFEINYDLEYTVHLTARPAFQINDSTLFYFQVGAAYGRFNSEVKNLLPQFDDVLKVEDKEDAWGVTLGTGIQKHLTECFSVFAAYEYTHFGHVDLSPIQKAEPLRIVIDRSATQTHGEFNRRESVLDSNTFKAGMIFTF